MVDLNNTKDHDKDHGPNIESRFRANSYETVASTPSSSSDYITGDADDSTSSRATVPFTLKSVETQLVISKDATQQDLQEMVQKCKQMILESAECSEERKWLVRRLIELRLRAQQLREASDETLLETRVIMGHHLVPQKHHIVTSGPIYCDHCSTTIWTVLQSWYLCSDCGFCCHWKCVDNICRVCMHVVASEAGGYTYTKDICPEQGLSAQGYRCAECNIKITFRLSRECCMSLDRSVRAAHTRYTFPKSVDSDWCVKILTNLNLHFSEKYSECRQREQTYRRNDAAWVEPRLCDYSGLYYCQRCHWNTSAVIPARVIRNWDMEPRRVCRAAAQLLSIIEQRPVLPLEELNPKLFSLVPDLSLVKKLREELQMMKRYLVFCPEANSQGLPWRAGIRTHLVESSSTYSVKDLGDLQSGVLLEEIRSAYDIMNNHITKQCELCKGRGHLCEICGNDEVIYPWEAGAIRCQQCSAVYHRACWAKLNHYCPKCVRIEKRHARESQNDADLECAVDNKNENLELDIAKQQSGVATLERNLIIT